jgi:acyl-CoA reductase-like NAD-dependent aldehyde dehydrogenase
LGPVQNLAQYESVKSVLAQVHAHPDARVLAGGRAREGGGYFIEPTIVAGLAEGTALVDQETFGPVLPIMSFANDEEAVKRANASAFGLGASVWSTDIAAAEAVARRLVAGTVWINRHVGVDPQVPFGGAKASGIGQQFGLAGLAILRSRWRSMCRLEARAACLGPASERRDYSAQARRQWARGTAASFHWPMKAGSRFSRKARKPSTPSRVP